MPWECCGTHHPDDTKTCATCGKTKAAWTMRLQVTRTFQIGPRTKAWLELEVLTAGGEPAAGEGYEVVLPSGKVRKGNLDDDGFVRIEKLPKSNCVVRFPGLDIVELARLPPADGGAPTAWLELDLKDELGAPLARERYQVTTGAGAVLEGYLDDRGRARLDGLPEGDCTVRFPSCGAEDFTAESEDAT